jgi:hypothetical protein
MAAGQLQTAFISAGYAVEPSIDWNWLNPPETSFRVLDRAADRVLLVEIFSDAASAQSQQQSTVPGFSVAISLGNVLIRQSSEQVLRTLATPDYELELLGHSSRPVLTPPSVVDAEFTSLVASAVPTVL